MECSISTYNRAPESVSAVWIASARKPNFNETTQHQFRALASLVLLLGLSWASSVLAVGNPSTYPNCANISANVAWGDPGEDIDAIVASMPSPQHAPTGSMSGLSSSQELLLGLQSCAADGLAPFLDLALLEVSEGGACEVRADHA